MTATASAAPRLTLNYDAAHYPLFITQDGAEEERRRSYLATDSSSQDGMPLPSPAAPSFMTEETELEGDRDDDGQPDDDGTRRDAATPQPPAREAAPAHPIVSMQGAFEESLEEVTRGSSAGKPKLRVGDAKYRRELLLEEKEGEEGHDKSQYLQTMALWRRRPSQTHHEVRKLMAQISFGVCLLLADMAQHPAEVVTILQGHIDEVDEFLEVVVEDLDEAVKDISTRISHLQLPMDNIEFFESMLENREYRAQVVDGNLIIEHIIGRTKAALSDWTADADEGVACTREFTAYLHDQQDGPWREELPEVIEVFDAMRGNVEGWSQTFQDLQTKCAVLEGLLEKLGGIIEEVDRRAGEASRRTRVSRISLVR